MWGFEAFIEVEHVRGVRSILLGFCGYARDRLRLMGMMLGFGTFYREPWI